jgi:drug/metabolite transporter (DMT)-like permease
MTQERVVVEVVVDEAVDGVVQTGIEPPQHPHAHDPGVVKGIELGVFAVFLFAVMDTLAKYLGRHYPVLGLVWARYVVHLLTMVAVFGPSMKFDLLRTQQLKLQLLRGLLLVASTCFFFYALKFLPMAEASAIGFVSPLLVTGIGAIFLKEKVSRRRWIAVAMGFFGVLIIVRPGGKVFTPAALLPLCSAVCFSCYQIVTRIVSHGGKENPAATLFYTALVGSVVLSLTLPGNWVVPTLPHGMLIVCLGALGGLGHFVLIRALTKAPASMLAPFYYTQLIWIMLFGYLFFGDFPDGWALVGMLIIVGSGLYVAYGERIHLHRVRISA